MPFDMTTVRFVADQDKYAQYRAEIAPLLNAIGGAFRYDFEINKTLKSEAGHDINRVFILRFPNRGRRNASSRTPTTRRSASACSKQPCGA